MQHITSQASLLRGLEWFIAMPMFYNQSSFSSEVADTEKEMMDLMP